MYRLIVSVAILAVSCLAVNVVEDCGPSDAWIKFKKLDISPMPFNILGKIMVDFDVVTSSVIGKDVKMSVKIEKGNLGNAFKWEIPCTNIGLIGDAAQGFTGYLGTCDYSGSCDFPIIKGWVDKQACPAFFADYKIPCTCPFPAQIIKTNAPVEIDLSVYQDKMPKWMIEGGYDVKVEMKDGKNNDKVVGCMKFKFDVNARSACGELEKKFGLC